MIAPSSALDELHLEQYLLGELPAREQARMDTLRQRDPAIQARLLALEAENAAILTRLPAAVVVPRIQARAAAATRAPGWPWQVAALAAACAGLLVAVMPPPERAPVSDVRTKGQSARLLVYRRAGSGGPEPLADGAVVRAGDVLQLAYTAPEGGYGVIISADGRGAVTLQAPDGPDAMPLSREAMTRLEFSYELDDAPGAERFVLVSSPRPFSTATVMGAAARLDSHAARLPLPERFIQTWVRLRRE